MMADSGIRRTWWVKLRRAKEHLTELTEEWQRWRDVEQEYEARVEIQSHEDGRWINVRGHVPRKDIDDDLAVFGRFVAIVGDIAANTRDALDHIETALTRSTEAHFPIITEDIWKPDLDPDTGEDRNKSRAESFRKNTPGTPAGTRAFIKALQPIQRDPQFPENDPLAFLRRLTNADKHRTLHFAIRMLFNTTTTITIPGFDEPWIIVKPGTRMDGAVVADPPIGTIDIEPVVHSSGGLEIVLKEADGLAGYWVLPDAFSTLIEYVEMEIITPLDAIL